MRIVLSKLDVINHSVENLIQPGDIHEEVYLNRVVTAKEVGEWEKLVRK